MGWGGIHSHRPQSRWKKMVRCTINKLSGGCKSRPLHAEGTAATFQ